MSAVAMFYTPLASRDFARGGRVVVTAISCGQTREGAIPTGIVIVALRQTESDAATETVFLHNEEFRDRRSAVQAWASRQGVDVAGVTI